MGSSCEGDALILCRLLGFAVNSFDRPPQLGAVGPVVYALNEFSPLSSFVIRCRFGDLIIPSSTTPACTWWNRPEEDLSSGKSESTHPSRTVVKSIEVFYGVESVVRGNADSLLN